MKGSTKFTLAVVAVLLIVFHFSMSRQSEAMCDNDATYVEACK